MLRLDFAIFSFVLSLSSVYFVQVCRQQQELQYVSVRLKIVCESVYVRDKESDRKGLKCLYICIFEGWKTESDWDSLSAYFWKRVTLAYIVHWNCAICVKQCKRGSNVVKQVWGTVLLQVWNTEFIIIYLNFAEDLLGFPCRTQAPPGTSSGTPGLAACTRYH